VTLPPKGSTIFTFTHRFDLVGEEARKVVNYPSFTLGAGLPASFALGITYASNSELGAGTPNEWELWARRRYDLAPRAALAATAGWNSAAKSADGELAARIILDRVLLLASVRGFSDAYGVGDGAVAVTGGAAWRITPRLSLAADAARVVTTDTLRTAWSLGLHLAIPGTPHTMGLAVSNVGAPTLQGASRGAEETEGGQNVRYGFAFTAPLGTLGQWARVFGGAEDRGVDAVTVRDFAFGPVEIHVKAGETVYWTNEDPTTHSITSDDGRYDSGPIAPGEGYSRRFEQPGRYTYHCTPHPFMKAVVVVDPG
jgi:plastocyanin